MLTRDLALPVNPWAALWAVAIAASWLLPTHLIPWRAFHADLLMTLALLPAAFWAVLYSRRTVPLHISVLVVLLSALIPLAQHVFGLVYFAGDAWITAAYLFGFGMAWMTGARFEQVIPGRLANVLFASIGAAAILSTGLALYQLLHLSGLGLLTLAFPPTGYRPFANLGQSNHLATLLVWGLIALWFAYLSGRARGWISWAAAAFLMVGIVSTQSRTAWVEMGLLLLACAVYRRPLGSRRYVGGVAALGALFVALILSWGWVTRQLAFDAVRTFADEMSPGLRAPAWRLFVDAITRRPWEGWGWNQISVAQSAVALDHPSLHYTFPSAHNLVLDLLLQNGIPLGAALVAALALWMLAKARRVDTPQACLLFLTVAVLLVHALLEFPQTYAYFLLPAGLAMGALDNAYPTGPVLGVKRRLTIVLLCLGVVWAGWIAVEYNAAERSLERVRFERARVGPSRHSQAPDLVMLTQLREFLRYLRFRSDQPVTPEQLTVMERVVERYPSEGNQLILAAAAASYGRPEVARVALARLCRMVPADHCKDALVVWRSMAATSPKLAAIETPR